MAGSFCPTCHSCFKLQDHIRIRKNRILCVKCKQPINLVFSDNISSKPKEVDLTDKQIKMHEYIERYYKAKDDSFKDVIKELCDTSDFRLKGSFAEFNPNSSERDIKYEIKTLLSDKDDIIHQNFGFFDQYVGKYVVKLYEDLQSFRAFFSKKAIEATYKEILLIFTDIIEKEERNNYEHNIFSIIKNRVGNRKAERNIIKEFMEYIFETNENIAISKIWKLKAICKKDLPPLLQRFGFQYDGFTDELNDLYEDIIDEIQMEHEKTRKTTEQTQADAFEKELDSSYEDLDIPNDNQDGDYDDDLLSDYLDEDIRHYEKEAMISQGETGEDDKDILDEK